VRDAETDQEKAKYLQHLFTYVQGQPPNSPAHEVARAVVEELGPDYIKSLGVIMPSMGVPAQSEMTPEVMRVMKLAVNPRFVATLDKAAPQYNQMNRNTFEQWANKKYPGWEKVQQALQRADMGTKKTG